VSGDDAAFRFVVGAHQGARVTIDGFGVRFMVGAEETGDRFALVEHPLEPRALAAPMHTHRREDEWSYVLAGRVGFQLADDVVEAVAGDLVRKPRGIPHSFWNAGDEAARVLEIISPGRFAGYFAELAPLVPPGAPPDRARIEALWAKYAIEMDLASVPVLLRRHGAVMPGFEPAQ
jgi:quercetin dioxygenase-like cupin family protein